MVGLLGCNCCGQTPSDYCSNGYESSLADDFSPDFEAGWASTTGLQCVSGWCQKQMGVGLTTGSAIVELQKQSEAGNVETTLKILHWPTTWYSQSSLERYEISVGIYPTFLVAKYFEVVAFRSFFVNSYVVRRHFGSFGLLSATLGIAPQSGDVFGYRCSSFQPVLTLPGTYVKPTLVEVLLNGSVVFSEAGYLEIPACDFDVAFSIRQPDLGAFPQVQLIRVDDFETEAL